MDWEKIENGKKLRKTKQFKDFKEAMIFVNKVASLAQRTKHHPDIFIQYNKVVMEITTHEKNSLTEKDFKLAQQIDELE